MGFFSNLFGGGETRNRAKEALTRGATVLDVRTPGEFAGGAAPNAKNIPVQELAARIGEVGPKDRPVVVYCASGIRSAKAAAMLTQAGYAEVIDVGGLGNFPRD